jgi:DNA-binding FadR family transcriptional regulator
LVKTIQKRDVEAARQAALEHVKNSARSALVAVTQNPAASPKSKIRKRKTG